MDFVGLLDFVGFVVRLVVGLFGGFCGISWWIGCGIVNLIVSLVYIEWRIVFWIFMYVYLRLCFGF